MKVLLINGSPHAEGCVYTALKEVEKGLHEHGIETEFFHVGDVSTPCQGCNGCAKTHRCVRTGDCVNAALEKIEAADGFVFGSPVHYANMSGNMKCFMDRIFMADSPALAYKPGAGICSANHIGTIAVCDQLNHYMGINAMPIVSSTYWNMVCGHNPAEVLQDARGVETMKNLGKNMAWLLRCIELGAQAGIR